MKRALLAIDVQYEYFTGKMPITYPVGSFNNILKAVDGANRNDVAVILIRHGAPQKDAAAFVKNSPGWSIHEELLRRQHMCIVDKTMPGSFTETRLEDLLRGIGVDTITICGYMTQMCCDTTARQAAHLGYSVEFLSDATGTLDISNNAGEVTAEQLHRAILVTQAMRFSEVISTDEWLERLST